MKRAVNIFLAASFFYTSSYTAVSGEIATILSQKTDYEQKHFVIPVQSPAKMGIWSEKLEALLQNPNNNLELDEQDLKVVSDLYIHSDAEYSQKLARFTEKLSDGAQEKLLPLVLEKRAPYGKVYKTTDDDRIGHGQEPKDATADLNELLRSNHLFERSIFASHILHNYRTDSFELSPEKKITPITVPANVPYDLVYYEPQEEKLKEYNDPEFDQKTNHLKGPSIKGFENSLGYRIYKPKNPGAVILLALYGGAQTNWQDDPDMADSYFSLEPKRDLYRYFLEKGVTIIDLANTPDFYQNTKHQSEMEKDMFGNVLQSINTFLTSDVYKDLKTEIQHQDTIKAQLYFFGASFGGLTMARLVEEHGRLRAQEGNPTPEEIVNDDDDDYYRRPSYKGYGHLNFPPIPELKGIISWNGALGRNDMQHLNPSADENIKHFNVPIKVLISSHDNQVLPSEFLEFHEQLKKHHKEHLLDVSIVRKTNTRLPETMALFPNYLGHFITSNAFPYVERFIQKNKHVKPLRDAVNASLAQKAALQKSNFSRFTDSVADYTAAEFSHAAYVSYDFYTHNKKREPKGTAEEDLRFEFSKAFMKICVQAIGQLKWKDIPDKMDDLMKDKRKDKVAFSTLKEMQSLLKERIIYLGIRDFDRHYTALYGEFSEGNKTDVNIKVKAKLKKTLEGIGFRPYLIEAFLNSEAFSEKTNALIDLVTNAETMALFFLAKKGVARGPQAAKSLQENVFSPLMVDFLWEALGEVILPYVEKKTPDLYQEMDKEVKKALQDCH